MATNATLIAAACRLAEMHSIATALRQIGSTTSDTGQHQDSRVDLERQAGKLLNA
jgi:hypothetical protein